MNKLLINSRIFLKRNASTILTCVGAVGVVATAVTAVQATPKAMKLIAKITSAIMRDRKENDIYEN